MYAITRNPATNQYETRKSSTSFLPATMNAPTTSPIISLTCCCCGEPTKGQQWHNRDTGFGICPKCVAWVGKRETPEEMTALYGVAGVHHSLPNAAKIFILRNYNSFVTGTTNAPKWESLGLHRYESDFARLLKFSTQAEALAYIATRPALESDFDAWAVEAEATDWNNITLK